MELTLQNQINQTDNQSYIKGSQFNHKLIFLQKPSNYLKLTLSSTTDHNIKHIFDIIHSQMQQEHTDALPDKLQQGLNIFFRQHQKEDKETKLYFEEQGLKVIMKKQTTQIYFDDIIGIKTETLKEDVFKVRIHTFKKQKKGWFSKQEERVLDDFPFFTKSTPQIIQILTLKVLQKITNTPNLSSESQLKLLAYFNPAAGSNSKQKLKKLLSFFSNTNFTLQVVQTKHQGHCKSHLSTISPKDYKGVLIISGDGLMHQFVNSDKCGKIPVSHVPAGSGNGFAKSQATEAGQPCSVETAGFLAVKGRTKEFNVARVDLQKQEEPIYSFLSIQWALMSDTDINSQFLRWMGGLRFQVYTIYRLLSVMRYPGKITYSFQQPSLPPLTQPITSPAFTQLQQTFLSSCFYLLRFGSQKFQVAPLLNIQDHAIDMQLVTSAHGRMSLIKYMLNIESGANFDKEKGGLSANTQIGWAKVKCFRLEPTGEGRERGVLSVDGEAYESQKVQMQMADIKLLTFA